MEKIGLIIGNGNLPYYFYQEAVKEGYEVFPIGLFDTINEELKKSNNYVQIQIGELGKLISYLILNKIEKIIMLGKVEKSLVFKDIEIDKQFQRLIMALPDRKDETLLYGIVSFLKENGIEVLPQNFLQDNLIAKEENYTEKTPLEIDKKSIEVGIEAARTLGKIDIGQTVVVKNMAVVALEAVEGTDETIRRARKYADEECIMIKMSRPQQDMRMDIPAIGLTTINELVENKFKGIVIEAGRVLFLDQEESIKKANENNLFIIGVK